MRVCLMFGVIVSATLYMPNSRAYDEFHAYLIYFVQSAAMWATVAVIARSAWRVAPRGGGNHRARCALPATSKRESPTPKL